MSRLGVPEGRFRLATENNPTCTLEQEHELRQPQAIACEACGGRVASWASWPWRAQRRAAPADGTADRRDLPCSRVLRQANASVAARKEGIQASRGAEARLAVEARQAAEARQASSGVHLQAQLVRPTEGMHHLRMAPRRSRRHRGSLARRRRRAVLRRPISRHQCKAALCRTVARARQPVALMAAALLLRTVARPRHSTAATLTRRLPTLTRLPAARQAVTVPRQAVGMALPVGTVHRVGMADTAPPACTARLAATVLPAPTAPTAPTDLRALRRRTLRPKSSRGAWTR